MSTRYLDVDPLTGIATTFRYDHTDDTFVIGEYQDCEAIIEHNKRNLIEADHKYQAKNDWLHYAKIPNVVICQWRTLHGVDFFNPDHEKAWKRLLNSPDYAYLRCSPYKHD